MMLRAIGSSTIATKIAIGFAFVLLINAAAVVSSNLLQKSITEVADREAAIAASKVEVIGRANRQATDISASMRNIAMLADEVYGKAKDTGSTSNNFGFVLSVFTKKELEEMEKAMTAEMEKLPNTLTELEKLIEQSSVDEKAERLAAKRIRVATRVAWPEMTGAVSLAKTGGTAAAIDQIARIVWPLEKNLYEALVEVERMQDTAFAQYKAKAEEKRKLATAMSYAALVASIVIGASAAYLIGRVVRRRTGDAIVSAERIASGDLDHQLSDAGSDEIAKMAKSFNVMVSKVVEGAKTIRKKSSDMAAMLSTMPQGLITFGADNKVHAEYSKYTEDILETDQITGQDVVDLVFSKSTLSSDQLAQLRAFAGACVGEDAVNFEFNQHILLREVTIKMDDGGSKILELTWSAICDEENTVDRILLCIRDVTLLKQLELEAEEQKLELEIVGQVLSIEHKAFASLLHSSMGQLQEIREALEGGANGPVFVNDTFRKLHTIKGNARTYGLKHLAAVTHDAEQVYADIRSGVEGIEWDPTRLLADLSRVEGSLERYRYVSDVKLGRGSEAQGGREVNLDDIRDVVQSLENAQMSEDVGRLKTAIRISAVALRKVYGQPLSTVLSALKTNVERIAADLGKPTPALNVVDSGVLVDPAISAKLNDMFVHLIRNALDHGLEAPSAREAAGKDPVGRIDIEVRPKDGCLQIGIRDDGRGLNMQGIRNIARAKQLRGANGEPEASMDDAAVAELIFHPGFSTSETITLTSGRGVGMDAVRSIAAELGGDASVAFVEDASSRPAGSTGHLAFETQITVSQKHYVQAR
jgi:two-component system chemotaxis sensor kinase CheA